jgi:hypothetical protein
VYKEPDPLKFDRPAKIFSKKGCSSKSRRLYFLSKLVRGCSSKVGGLYFLSKKKQNKNGDDILNKRI